MTRASPQLRAGLGALLAMGAVAALAPLLAGSRPLLVVSRSRGVEMPALGAALHWLPEGAPESSFQEGWQLKPPIQHDPLDIDLGSRLLPPGRSHWLGTDELGRDILARLIHATRPALLVAMIATAVSLMLGIPVGAAAGYGGRGVDLVLSRLIEASLSFPALVLLLLLASVSLRQTLGGAGSAGPIAEERALSSLFVVGGAVGIARWGIIARYMRGEILRLSRTDLAAAALASGGSSVRVLARHLIPAGLGPVVVSAAFGAGAAVVAEASLSFLGMGVQPPSPTWGQMIASAWLLGSRHWWMLVFPAAMVALMVGSFNLIGEGLRKAG